MNELTLRYNRRIDSPRTCYRIRYFRRAPEGREWMLINPLGLVIGTSWNPASLVKRRRELQEAYELGKEQA